MINEILIQLEKLTISDLSYLVEYAIEVLNTKKQEEKENKD